MQMHQVAESVQDRDQPHAREQKGEDIAQGKVVVDRADQHHAQRHAECEAGTGRQDVDAILPQEDGAGLRLARTEEREIELRALRIFSNIAPASALEYRRNGYDDGRRMC